MSDLEPEELPADARAMLADEARRSDPGPERVERIRRGVERALSSRPLGESSSDRHAASAPRGPLWFVGGVTVGALLVALLWRVSPPRTIVVTQTVLVRVDAAVAPATVVQDAASAPERSVAIDAGALASSDPDRPDAALARPRGARVEIDMAPDLALRAERELIETAQSALARRAWTDAIRACAEHLRRFTRAQLVEEREAVWIQALAGEGRSADAWARAESFRRRFPSSLLRTVVDRAAPELPRAP